MTISFTQHGTVFFKPLDKQYETSKIHSFDLDDTLIKTKSHKKFAVGPDDWEFWDPQVLPYLVGKLQADEAILIISNQKGVSNGKTDINDFTKTFNQSLSAIQAHVGGSRSVAAQTGIYLCSSV